MNNCRKTFPKIERLSWKRHIDLLFQKGESFVSFPLKVIYLPIDKEDTDTLVSILVSVSKKRFKNAVDRNYIKRRVRESYRLRKHDLLNVFAGKNKKMLLAFLYLHNEKSSFAKIDRAMAKVLKTIQELPE